MKKILLFILVFPITVSGQNYTSYFTGNSTDVVTQPTGGVCLMGGASEDDNAMMWFLQRANGGDVLVLRASGSNGYNNYLYTDLGVSVNSVETIVFNNALANNDPYVIQKINQAEAIWFAGGDQYNYISYWRNSPVDSAINQAIEQRNIVIGGTSAGMAIQGKFYFSAQNGTVTSSTALANPFHPNVTIDSAAFIKNDYLQDVITDTHFDNPDRKGRLTTFLARILVSYGIHGKAIACDEYTAVCIDPSGLARVYGGYPAYEERAYFVQTNCELTNQLPESCTTSTPLTWNHGGEALKVYQVYGTANGANTFNLNDWKTGAGGTWKHWSVQNGTFTEQDGDQINCLNASMDQLESSEFVLAPNPTNGKIGISIMNLNLDAVNWQLYNATGQSVKVKTNQLSANHFEIDLSDFSNGIYYLRIEENNLPKFAGKIVKN